MLVIGVAGGVASGKSTVASLLGELGAVILDADKLGHQVLLEPIIKLEVRKRFGDAIFDGQSEIVRSRLAKLVFGGEPQSQVNLVDLERITHPRIGQLIREELDSLHKTGSVAVVLDAAVMFKAGWDSICDRIVFVEAAESVRINRAKLRGWTEQEFRQRESQQLPLAEKLKKATEVIDNQTDNRDDLRLRVRNIWRQWGLPIDLAVNKKSDSET